MEAVIMVVMNVTVFGSTKLKNIIDTHLHDILSGTEKFVSMIFFSRIEPKTLPSSWQQGECFHFNKSSFEMAMTFLLRYIRIQNLFYRAFF